MMLKSTKPLATISKHKTEENIPYRKANENSYYAETGQKDYETSKKLKNSKKICHREKTTSLKLELWITEYSLLRK